MRKKEVKIITYILIFALALLLVFFLKTSPLPTGFFVYKDVPSQKSWDFVDATEYVYDNSQINMSTGQVQLIPVVTTTTTTILTVQPALITSSLLRNPGKNPNDTTSTVQTIDGDFVTLQKPDSVLDVTFDTALANGDTISLYLLAQNNVNTDVYLCDAATTCAAPGYGQITFNENEGWYNITLSGLPSPTATLGIDPPNHIKVDQVTATHQQTVEESTTTTTYPYSANLQTADVQPANLKSWGTFSSAQQLNGEQVTYFYSTDSGTSWNSVPVNGNLSPVTGSKIRFKAQLQSSGDTTPIITQMAVQYTVQQECTQNWVCTDWAPATCPENGLQGRTCTDSNSCGSTENKPAEQQSCTYVPPCVENWILEDAVCRNDDTKLKRYADANNCGTTASLPSDNGTTVSCDYCVPNWKGVNESCEPDNTLISHFIDSNSCYTLTGLDNDTLVPPTINFSCNYCTGYNCSSSTKMFPIPEVIGNNTFWKVDSHNFTNVALEIYAASAPEEVSILHYDYNIQNESPDAVAVNRFLEINSTSTNISLVKIIIYYTEAELAAAGIDEKTLAIHYFNETSQEWEQLVSAVNLTGNYVWAEVPHLSLYGLFGQPVVPETAPAAASSSGGGGGGGSSRRSGSTPAISSVLEKSQPVLEQPGAINAPETPELEAGTVCNYVVELSLPDKVSLTEEDSFPVEVVNNGNCAIPFLSLGLSPELASEVDLPSATATNLGPGGKSTFTLIRRQDQKLGLLSSITGSVITNVGKSNTITGSVVVEAAEDDKVVYHQSLPLAVEVLDSTWVLNMKLIAGINLLVIVVVLMMILAKRRTKKRGNKIPWSKRLKLFTNALPANSRTGIFPGPKNAKPGAKRTIRVIWK